MREEEILKELKHATKDEEVSFEELRAAIEARKHATEIKGMATSRYMAMASLAVSLLVISFQGWSTYKSSFRTELDKYYQVLEKQIASENARYLEVKKRNDKLKTANEGIKELVAKKPKLEKDLNDLEADIEALNQQKTLLSGQITSLESQINSLNAVDGDVKRWELALKTQIANLNTANADIEDKNKKITGELSDEKKKSNALTSQLSQLEMQIASQESEKQRLSVLGDFRHVTFDNITRGEIKSIWNAKGDLLYDVEVASIDRQKEEISLRITPANGSPARFTGFSAQQLMFVFNGQGFVFRDFDRTKLDGNEASFTIGVFTDGNTRLVY